MNMSIAFFVGCFTFVVIMLVKIPIKKLMSTIAENRGGDEEEVRIIYRRGNSIIYVLVMLVAAISYCLVLELIGEEHFKLCCSMKAAAIAVALYAIFEQWFGDDFKL